MMNQPVAVVTTTQTMPGYGGAVYAPPQQQYGGYQQPQYGQPQYGQPQYAQQY